MHFKRNSLEKTREKKWIWMLDRWPKQIKPTDKVLFQTFKRKSFFIVVLLVAYRCSKLFTRIFKGIPNSLRGKVWARLLDVENQKRLHSGVYAKMILPKVSKSDLCLWIISVISIFPFKTDKSNCSTCWPPTQYTTRKSGIVRGCPIYARSCSCICPTKK